MNLIHLVTLGGVPRGLRVACLGSVGCLVGMSVYVAHISEATSYLSDDPKACINCHVMTSQYASWQHSSHGAAATCNDCHVPQDNFAKKYFYKAMDGARHTAKFTLRMEPQVIRARAAAKHIIQNNCIRCHGDQVRLSKMTDRVDRSCVDCHREVPHGSGGSLSSAPNAAVPLQESVLPAWMEQLQNRRQEEK